MNGGTLVMSGQGLRRAGVALLAIVMLLTGAPAPAGAASTGAARVGLLLVDHGEPPAYNEFTYWSFREFFGHLMDMGVIPSWLRYLDTGTVAADRGCCGCETPRDAGHVELMDAWLRPP